MRRRDLLPLLAAGAAIPPLVAGAQQPRVPVVINLRTAKALGLTVPLLARADEVIE